MALDRRRFLQRAGALPLLSLLGPLLPRAVVARPSSPGSRRVRPSDQAWPPPERWEALKQEVRGRLVRVQSPFAACKEAPGSAACEGVFKSLKNPYDVRDQAGLTQTTGWVDAWATAPSVYAVAARNTDDVVAAVKFARQNNLRLVVKGGGHSYQGTSNAPDSLLVWTREMTGITLHDAFVGTGCAGAQAPQPAVTVGAGAIWMHTYDAVTTKGGRYVQGGGCGTVGVAGLVQSGGFGSFSKNYGMAAAGLLEAEVVTADGAVRIANPCTNPDLFWGLKGGGGGSLGVVTRLTLRTHELPGFFGVVFATIKATSSAAFHRLIARFMAFYGESLFNPHWGETVSFRPDNTLAITMLSQGTEARAAEAAWKPFFDWVAAAPQDFNLPSQPRILAVPARNFWDAEYIRKTLPGAVLADDRPGAPAGNIFWSTNLGEAGQFLHAYESTWLPASLLRKGRQSALSDALFAASRPWGFSLHFNKGLAGAPAEAVAAARDTATNPAVLDAFALAISADEGPPAYPGIVGHEPDVAAGRKARAAIAKGMGELRKLVPQPGSYVSESNYFERNWQQAFWGANYPKLLAVKRKYDPTGLFFVHHGVGSEEWSADGFTRVAAR
jgi:FAD/FMN-containing dehydrogenase